MKIEELVREEALELSLYEVESVLKRKLDERVVKMDLNENFTLASDVMKKLLLEACRNIDVRVYPPPCGDMAIKAISSFLGFNESEISVENGARGCMEVERLLFCLDLTLSWMSTRYSKESTEKLLYFSFVLQTTLQATNSKKET